MYVYTIIFLLFLTLRHPELVSGSAQSTDAALRLRLVRTGSQSSPSVLTFPLSNKVRHDGKF